MVETGQEHELLEHPTRRRIVDTLEIMPGMNKNQLRHELDVGLKVLDYHLTKMEDEGLVVRKPSAQDKEVLYFRPEDTDLWENPRTRIMFGRRPTRHVGLYLADHPGAGSNAIADALDLSVVTVRHHLRTLRDHDLIVSAKIGRSVEYHPLNELRAWAKELGDNFDKPWLS